MAVVPQLDEGSLGAQHPQATAARLPAAEPSRSRADPVLREMADAVVGRGACQSEATVPVPMTHYALSSGF